MKVNITELDLDVLPAAMRDRGADVTKNAALNAYTAGLPDSVQQQLAHRYADLFRVVLRHLADIGIAA